MTPESQRIAIAEACPNCIRFIVVEGAGELWQYATDGFYWHECKENDPLNDLNAMHEAEKVLRENQFHFVDYPRQLFRVVSGRDLNEDMGYFTFNFIHATAAQRAEALLRTLGLWK